MSATVRVLYLARLREALGRAEEEITLEREGQTLDELIETLRRREGEFAKELAQHRAWRVAVNHELVPASALARPLAPGDEIAFFPPVTGGE
ncbi:MAG: molybdopterin converting factor subunit 1 [Casimicrobiaceae bacterium]|nr:molybdopterin converting factor subunit 1 [Casimicrobiaceae bacterium]MCX8099112.1 molybdopterin converting factor subunit 1 [Casimicrobiaceae bacterium]MDW8312179.1 molybdopterin converting factor subunit 1 [Burkholderiales bacterium]